MHIKSALSGPHPERHQLTRGSLVLALLLASGCTSLDPAEDLDRAMEITAPRIGDAMDPSSLLEHDPRMPSTRWNVKVPLDVNTAVMIAFERDTAIRVAMQEIVARRAELVDTELPSNPVIGVGIGAEIDGLSGAPSTAMIMQQLTWLWQRPFRMDAADARRRHAILSAANQAVSLNAQVRIAHTRVFEAQQDIDITRRQMEISEKTLQIVNRLAEAGENSLLDVDEATRSHAETEAAYQDSLHVLRLRQIKLLAIMGMPDFSTEWETIGDFELDSSVPDENELVNRSRLLRLDVAEAAQAVEVAHANAGLADTRRLPDVGVNLGWHKGFSGRQALVPGINVSVPLFNNGSPAIAIADAQTRIALLNLLETERRVVEQTRTALEQWRRSDQQAHIYRDRVLAPAISAQERSQKAYSAGKSSLRVVLATQHNRFIAERSLLAHEAAATTDLINLERAVGGSFQLPLERPRVETSPPADDAEESTS